MVAWLGAAHVTVPAGWSLTNATGVSNDGTVVVGNGTDPANNSEAWLARVSPIGSGLINVPDFTQSLINTGSAVASVGVNLSSLTMDGAHHRTLLDSGLGRDMGNGMGMWVTGDAAHYNASNSDIQLTEIGVYKDIGSTRAGLGIGQAWDQQGLNSGGSARYNGQYLIAEVAKMITQHLEGSMTGYYGGFDTHVSRNYQNGGGISTSSGTTTTTSTSARLRLDWLEMAKLGQFSFSPYTAYTWTRAKVGAYTETGGGFPAAYNSSRTDSDTLRIGLDTKTSLSSATDLSLNTEVVHNFQANSSGVSGQTIGLGGFAVAGLDTHQDWVRVMLDIDHRISKQSLISLGINGGSEGGDPSYGATVSYRASF